MGNISADMFPAACPVVTFRFISRSGREEKKIIAHDGAALLTGEEDGDLKIWSRIGNWP